MTTIHFDSPLADTERREKLYAGDFFVYSRSEASETFCAFAADLTREAFADDDPETAQFRLPKEKYIEILSELKPRFIHHPKSKEYVRDVLAGIGCDLLETFYDVPRMRSSTSDDYLTTGIAYAWHPHRDTWYSAPPAQINLWLPIFPISSENTIAFHPAHFDQPVPNDSEKYNYYEWNSKFRAAAASQGAKESRPLPGPRGDVERDSEVRIVCPAGGMILFSGDQLHSSVPNTSGRTRFSIDFRIVNTSDIRAGKAAPTVDANCTGSSIRDFHRACDAADMDKEIVDLFTDGTESRGDLVYKPQ